ncbi:phosphopantetheine attachment site protein [Medicago truncatula]|uniref:Phosphopantetheine attachment site protein n=1 Tax=Medicago truncatula TaxID=3880 RepID=G7L9E8_MEDTR|nr:phosphopantetheine attachment site protein [Medicago truncatula]
MQRTKTKLLAVCQKVQPLQESLKFTALGADSLDTVEIVMVLEEEFGISVEEESYSCRVLQRWAGYVLHSEHNIWRYHCLIYPFYLNSTTIHSILTQMTQSLASLREAQLPDTGAMFILACREIHAEIVSDLGITDVVAVDEYFGQYQRKLVHLCMDSHPSSD